MDHWGILWGAWAAVTAGSFAVIEGTALGTGRDDRTLSARIRALLGISPPRPWRRAAVVAFLAALWGFTIWFSVHIVPK